MEIMPVSRALLKQLCLWQELDLMRPLLVFIFLLSLVVLFNNILRSCRSKLNLPPSPPRLPLIGNLHQIRTPPHRSVGALSEKYGPLMLLHMGQAPTLIVSSADMVKEIVKNHDITFSNRPKTTAANILLYGGQGLGFAPYGEYWRQARKICVVELLSFGRVQKFQFVKEEETVALIERIRQQARQSGINNGSSINLTKMLIAAVNNIVCRCAFGRKFSNDDDDLSRFGKLISRKLLVSISAFSVGDLFPSLKWLDHITGLIGRLKQVFREMDIFFYEIIEEHKAVLEGGSSMKKDFVDILLGVQEHGMPDFELTRDNIKAILLDIFFAGSDTTSTALEWVMAELLRHPKVMKKAQEEVRRVVGNNRSKINTDDVNQMDYLNCVIKETLRLHPPLPFLIPRETAANIEIKGFHIPKNTRVFINAWAIQRDPNVWDKPEDFLPERFHGSDGDFKGQDFEFIPFGSGRRGCPGMTFGVSVIKYVMANLLYWFDWNLPGDHDNDARFAKELDMNEVFGLSLHKEVPLNLVPIPAYSP